jgi:GAF domain-containing protein
VACDERANSEIAVPVFDGAGHVVAVLDVDSEARDDFDDVDVSGLEEICRIVSELYKRGDG